MWDSARYIVSGSNSKEIRLSTNHTGHVPLLNNHTSLIGQYLAVTTNNVTHSVSQLSRIQGWESCSTVRIIYAPSCIVYCTMSCICLPDFYQLYVYHYPCQQLFICVCIYNVYIYYLYIYTIHKLLSFRELIQFYVCMQYYPRKFSL